AAFQIADVAEPKGETRRELKFFRLLAHHVFVHVRAKEEEIDVGRKLHALPFGPADRRATARCRTRAWIRVVLAALRARPDHRSDVGLHDPWAVWHRRPVLHGVGILGAKT